MLTGNHRKAFDCTVQVKEQMGIATEKLDQYKSMAEFLGSKRYTSENIIQYFNEVFRTPCTKRKWIMLFLSLPEMRNLRIGELVNTIQWNDYERLYSFLCKHCNTVT